jgi:hypothetical protein
MTPSFFAFHDPHLGGPLLQIEGNLLQHCIPVALSCLNGGVKLTKTSGHLHTAADTQSLSLDCNTPHTLCQQNGHKLAGCADVDVSA